MPALHPHTVLPVYDMVTAFLDGFQCLDQFQQTVGRDVLYTSSQDTNAAVSRCKKGREPQLGLGRIVSAGFSPRHMVEPMTTATSDCVLLQ